MGFRRGAGFTMIEMVVSIAIIGILTAIFVPGLINPTDVRTLDGSAREIMGALQLARWQAGTAKLNHRVRFYAQGSRWWYVIEVEAASGTWTIKPGQAARSLPTKLAFTANLPTTSAVAFLPTGFVSGFDSSHCQLSLTSAKLNAMSQPGRRLIRVFASGSLRLTSDNGVGA